MTISIREYRANEERGTKGTHSPHIGTMNDAEYELPRSLSEYPLDLKTCSRFAARPQNMPTSALPTQRAASFAIQEILGLSTSDSTNHPSRNLTVPASATSPTLPNFGPHHHQMSMAAVNASRMYFNAAFLPHNINPLTAGKTQNFIGLIVICGTLSSGGETEETLFRIRWKCDCKYPDYGTQDFDEGRSFHRPTFRIFN